LERTFKGHLVQSPAISRAIFNCSGLLKPPPNLTLNVSRGGAPTTSLGNLFQCSTTLAVKDLFLITSLNRLSFSLKPLPLVPSQQLLLRNFSQFIFSIQHLEDLPEKAEGNIPAQAKRLKMQALGNTKG